MVQTDAIWSGSKHKPAVRKLANQHFFPQNWKMNFSTVNGMWDAVTEFALLYLWALEQHLLHHWMPAQER